MTNYNAQILGIALSGIRAHQTVIGNAGSNIANVNTPGYSRRTAVLQPLVGSGVVDGLSIGNGVEVSSIQRRVDQFLERQLQLGTSEASAAGIERDYLQRAAGLFNLSGDKLTIGSTLTSFFNAANDLALNASSIELRRSFLEKAQNLVETISSTYDSLATLQDEANTRLAGEVGTVNSLTSQIAELNLRISSASGAGISANDELDVRQRLLQQLGEKISYSTVDMPDGSVTISLSNGFTLVNGATSRSLEVTNSPSFGSGSMPQSLSGGLLSYVVYDYSGGAGTQHYDFTNILKNEQGTIGGLLKVRGYVDPTLTTPSAFQADGHLVELASQVEAITRTLLTSVNQIYLGPDRLAGTPGWQASSGDLNGNPPSVYGLFDFEFSGIKDTDADGYPDDFGTHSLGNYSSRLTLAFSDPRRIAAALDLTPDPAPAATFAPGDGRNMLAIAGLRTQSYTFSTGSHSFTGSFDEAYQNVLTTASNKQSRAELNASVADSRLSIANTQRDQVSAVSLEEEFTTLITSQKAYQASARMIRTAQELLDELLQVL